MMKKAVLVAIAAVVSALIFQGTHKKIEPHASLSEQKTIAEKPMVIAKEKAPVKPPKEVVAYKNIVKRKIAATKDELMLLKGVHATSEKQNQEDLGRVNNFYVYPANSESEENIVYSSARNQYGLLTREIIVTGEDEMVQALAQKYKLSIEKEGRMGSEYILRAQDSAFFTQEIAQLKAEDGIFEVRPYVQYGQAKLK